MADMLDISILSINKYLTNDKRKETFLYSPCSVEAKIDGIKLTLLKVDNTGDYNKDFIVAYKGKIQYSGEYDYFDDDTIKKSSTGNSQFKLVFNHLKSLSLSDYQSIPNDTEFFIEFAVKKNTLMSNYQKHGMVLLAYSKSSYTERGGMLKTKPQGFNTDLCDKYAKMLRVMRPAKLFDGVLADFRNGIKSSELRNAYEKYKPNIDKMTTDEYIQAVVKTFLDIDSVFGGKEEGVVLTFDGFKLKIQQDYQLDKEARRAKKRFADPEVEAEYWENVNNFGKDNYNQIQGKTLNDRLRSLSDFLRKAKIDFTHPNKEEHQIIDDIQVNMKNLILKNLEGNNNFLMLGKYRILTNGHYKVIENGLKNYDGGVICVVTSKETKETEKIRIKMIKKAFPKIEVITHSTGLITSILNKCPVNVNAVLCGTDRVRDYENMLKGRLDVVETPRTDDDISASKVIANIDNETYFKQNTPKAIHSMYKELLAIYGNRE